MWTEGNSQKSNHYDETRPCANLFTERSHMIWLDIEPRSPWWDELPFASVQAALNDLRLNLITAEVEACFHNTVDRKNCTSKWEVSTVRHNSTERNRPNYIKYWPNTVLFTKIHYLFSDISRSMKQERHIFKPIFTSISISVSTGHFQELLVTLSTSPNQ